MIKLNVKTLRPLAAVSGVILTSLAIAGCVPSAPKPTPAPASRPAPAPITRAPVVVTPPQNWMDAPATPGDWSYRATSGGSQALFGQPGAGVSLTLQCNRAAGQVLVVRPGNATAPVPMRILTETQAQALTASPDSGDRSALVASIPARDPLLDAMAISKGRFAVETAGLPTIYAPSWPEITRVIEDCR